MSAPVTTDDLVQGAHKYLSSKSDLIAALGAFADDTPYLFQHQLWAELEGTSSNAVVLLRGTGGWAAPNPHNTMRFPRLGVEITCDPLRDASGNITDPGECQRRIEAVFRLVDTHLHRPQGGTQMWGTVRTIGSTRLSEAVVYPVEDGSGMQRMLVYYGVTEG